MLAVLVGSVFLLGSNTNSNRQLIPLGETEAFLGNSGVGRATDTGAVYYNPSGIAELGAGRVSVTGSAYMSFNTRSDSALYVESSTATFRASGFNTIPAFYVAATKLDEWSAAISILVPSSLQIDNRIPFTTPNATGSLIEAIRASDLWMGVSGARRWGERWSAGASVFGIQHQESTTVAVDISAPGGFSRGLASAHEQVNLSVFGLSATLGASFKAADWLRLGVRAQTALWQLMGKADTYEVAYGLAGGTLSTAGDDHVAVHANYRMPFDFTFGTAFLLTPQLTLLADLSLQLGIDYWSIPDSALSEEVKLKPTPRANFGLEYKASEKIALRTGFFFNPSAIDGSPGVGLDYSAEDFYGLTAGVGWTTSHVQTGVGGFYQWSSGKASPGGAPVGTVGNVYSHALGAILTTSYFF